MHNPPDKHPFVSDELFREVIAMEVDSIDDSLSAEERERCIRAVSERMQAEIEEHLASGDLDPASLSMRTHVEAERAVDGGATAA